MVMAQGGRSQERAIQGASRARSAIIQNKEIKERPEDRKRSCMCE